MTTGFTFNDKNIKIINYTCHPVRIYKNLEEVLVTIPPTDKTIIVFDTLIPSRLGTFKYENNSIQLVDLNYNIPQLLTKNPITREYTDNPTTDIPIPDEDTYYLVSQKVKNSLPDFPRLITLETFNFMTCLRIN